MKGLVRPWRPLGLFLAFAVISPACRYSVNPDSGKFHCASDSDCGGGWHCFSSCLASGFSAYCLENGSCEACPSLGADPSNCGSCGTACPSGDECIDGVCVSVTLLDAGVDAGEDAGPDAGTDAGVDGGEDAGRDGGLDAGRDAGEDAGLHDGGLPDGASDAGDAGEPDSGLRDGGAPDASTDAGEEDGGDAGPDAGS